MQKLKIALAIFALIMLIYFLAFVLEYDNLSLRNNIGNYAGIFSMICIIIVMIGSYRSEQKSQGEVERNESGA